MIRKLQLLKILASDIETVPEGKSFNDPGGETKKLWD
jgi:hypothetical protein